MKETTRTWIGGGDNQASNPNNWADPNGQPGVPHRGDALIMNSGTINVTDNDLKGDTFTVGSTSTVINLENAKLNFQASSAQPGVTFRLNASGSDSLNIVAPENPNLLLLPIINLADNAHLLMKGDLQFSGYSINGGAGSEIINNGDIKAGRSAFTSINTNVEGRGSIAIGPATRAPSVLTMNGKVGRGQTLEVMPTVQYPATLDIKQPNVFHGLIDVPSPPDLPFVSLIASVILEDLTATSYSVKGDKLYLYDGYKKVDTLRLHNPTDQSISVGQSGSNVVLGINETAPGGILPTHGFV